MSNPQAVAALSHGLIVDAPPGDFPSPYDVRIGVDNGAGELGTLTSPVSANVRAGTLYGGDGTQYTGTLYVPSSSGGNTWTDEMRELFYEEISDSEFGVTVIYNGAPYRCIKTPVKSGFGMKPSMFERQADSIVDMWRDDVITSGLYEIAQNNPTNKRPILTIGERQYEVIKLENDDATNPVIRLSCSQLQ